MPRRVPSPNPYSTSGWGKGRKKGSKPGEGVVVSHRNKTRRKPGRTNYGPAIPRDKMGPRKPPKSK